MEEPEAQDVETIRLAVAGAGTRAEIAGAWHDVAAPEALWRLIGERSAASLVHIVDRRAMIDAGAVHSVARKVRDSATEGAVARVRYVGGALSPLHEHADAALSVVTAPGSVLASPALFAAMASRPVHAVWDAYWASDLHRVAYRNGRLIGCDDVVAELDLPAPTTALLPIERAGDRPHDPGAPTVVVYGPVSASSALTFDAFATAAGINLRYLRTAGEDPWFLSASAIIVSRMLHRTIISGELRQWSEAGLSVFWFLDDNFFALGDEYPELAFYRPENFAGIERHLAAIIVSTPPLKQVIAELLKFPRERIRVLPPRPSPDWPRRRTEDRNRGIGIIGSDFRGEGLRQEVVPALAALGGRCPIYAVESMRRFLGTVEATYIARQFDFHHFLHVWTALSPAAIVHPPGNTRNIGNKADSVIMLSHLMGAVPILAPEPAFEGWGESEGVLKAGPGEWSSAIARAIDDKEGAVLRDRLARAFAGPRRLGAGAKILLDTLDHRAAGLPGGRDGRLVKAGQHPVRSTPRRTGVVPDPSRIAWSVLPPVLTAGLNRIAGWRVTALPLPTVTANNVSIPVFDVPESYRDGSAPPGTSKFEAFLDCWRLASPGGMVEMSAVAGDGSFATETRRFQPTRRLGATPPLTVFLHLPKTAGTTLRVALQTADSGEQTARLTTMYEESPHFRNHLLEGLSRESLSEIEFLYGHLNTSIEKTLTRIDPDREIRFVTVTREPRAFLKSYFFAFRSRLPELGGHDLFSFISRRSAVTDNLFCRLIVGRPVTKVDKPYLEEAKDMLWRRFLFVGATENMTHTMRRVGALTGYDLSAWSARRVNETPPSPEREAIDARRFANLTEPLVRYDEQLCAYARRLFD